MVNVMDTRDTENETAVDADTFRQWVRHTAESREMTEHELLNQLVSAFWALDEMSDIGLHAASDSEKPNPGEGPEPDAFRDEKTASDPTPDVDEGEASDLFDTELLAQLDPDNPDSGDDFGPTVVELMRRVAELRRQMKNLSLDVERQRSRQEEFTDRLSDDVTRLHSEIQSLNSRVDQPDTELQNRIDDVEKAVEDVEATQDEFETWVDTEFDQIEALFKRVLDTIDDFDDRVEEIEDLADTVSAVKKDREDLNSLRKQAARKGVDTGSCENCGTTVDLAMLSEPSCPSCGESFRDIDDTGSWNPFSKPTLRTDGRPPRPPKQE